MPTDARVLLPAPIGASWLAALPGDVPASTWSPGEPLRDADQVEFWVPPFPVFDVAAAVEKLPRLRVIQLMTAGYDYVARHVREDVTVHTVGEVHSAAVSEWVVAAMLAMQRELPAYARLAPEGRVQRLPSAELDGSRVLIVGYGSIGRAVERRLSGFDVEVTRVSRRAGDGVHSVDQLARLARRADILVMLAPLTEQTDGLVDAEILDALPDNALVVSASRGELFDQDALVARVASGRLRAALDVTVPDPLPAGSPFLALPGLLYTPHVAASTDRMAPRLGNVIVPQVRRYFAGEPLEHHVPRERLGTLTT